MRDIPGFIESRQLLLKLKPNSRPNWISMAVAHHLNGRPEVAAHVLGAYENIQVSLTLCSWVLGSSFLRAISSAFASSMGGLKLGKPDLAADIENAILYGKSLQVPLTIACLQPCCIECPHTCESAKFNNRSLFRRRSHLGRPMSTARCCCTRPSCWRRRRTLKAPSSTLRIPGCASQKQLTEVTYDVYLSYHHLCSSKLPWGALLLHVYRSCICTANMLAAAAMSCLHSRRLLLHCLSPLLQ